MSNWRFILLPPPVLIWDYWQIVFLLSFQLSNLLSVTGPFCFLWAFLRFKDVSALKIYQSWNFRWCVFIVILEFICGLFLFCYSIGKTTKSTLQSFFYLWTTIAKYSLENEWQLSILKNILLPEYPNLRFYTHTHLKQNLKLWSISVRLGIFP